MLVALERYSTVELCNTNSFRQVLVVKKNVRTHSGRMMLAIY